MVILACGVMNIMTLRKEISHDKQIDIKIVASEGCSMQQTDFKRICKTSTVDYLWSREKAKALQQ